MKSQSAMEYLMTYGWAILIIAVVLGALYSLGLFNGAALAPRSQPGACQVYRPNGPSTTQYISLEGACTNELPQYVGQFNGQSSSISVSSPGIGAASNTSILVWIKPSTTTQNGIFQNLDGCNSLSTGYFLAIRNVLDVVASSGGSFPGDYAPGGTPIQLNTWSQVGFVWAYNSPTTSIQYLILNGKILATHPVSMPVMTAHTQNVLIGSAPTCWPASNFNGSISNIQVYNTSLDANSVLALYQEGIGGAPINLQGLIAWWPLNGNANDYSGNLNNGAPTKVTYTNQWLSGYTTP